MIDYISITKNLHKDTPSLEHCNWAAGYSSGWQVYYAKGIKEMKVRWNPDAAQLKLQGSLMYFLQGHNFTCGKGDFVQGIEYLQGLLHVGLWDSSIEVLEFGTIMEVEYKPALYIKNHHARKGVNLTESEKGGDKGSCRKWENSLEQLKMYDARKNLMQKQGLQRRAIIEQAGWNPDAQYLKFEAHYLKPALLNSGNDLLLEDVLQPAVYENLKKITQAQYQLLEPMRTLELPTDKKNLTSADIVLQAFVEGFINAEGCTPQEAKKALFKRVNMIPDAILTKADKDGRKRQINALFDRVEVAPESQWDLTGKIADAFASDWKQPEEQR